MTSPFMARGLGLRLSASGFMLPDIAAGNLKLLFQTSQDCVERGIMIEDTQDGIVESEWQV
jgi:hypothetical protein